MDRLAYEHTGFADASPVAEPFAATASLAGAPPQPPTGTPDAPRTPENGTATGRDGKLTIEVMASTSQQAPAEWMTEMMVYWLLDLAAQYDGVTPDLIRQAAERLATQYAQACRESPY
jgi:hypothetical protein